MKKCLIPICALLFWACKKEPDGCLGCGNTFPDPKHKEFTFNGHIVEDCTGKPAANKIFQAFVLKGTDTVGLQTITAGLDGQFKFTYTIEQASYIPFAPYSTPPVVIRVLDDSLQFFIPATIEFSNLILNLNDPITCKINTVIDPQSRAFTASDTIICRPSSGNQLYSNFNQSMILFKKGGPFTNGTIGNINGRMKVINIDELGQPFIKLIWDMISNNSSSFSSGDTARATKKACIIRQDSIVFNLRR